MRTLILVGLFMLSMLNAFAQERDKDPAQVQPDSKAQERIKNLRIAYLSEKLGLTPDQARVLRAWCRDNEIAEVPLAPTISFANWIYLGYFLTALLQGHVLQAAY